MSNFPEIDTPDAGSWFGGLWESMPSIPGRATAHEVQETARAVQGVINDPENFFKGATRGIVAGLQAQKPPVEGEAQPLSDEGEASLATRVSQIVWGGFSATSSYVLKQLVEHSEVHDPDIGDENLQADAIQMLIANKINEAWKRLSNYHIIFGSVNVNPKSSFNEEMREERVKSEGVNNDGSSPIHALIDGQNLWRSLRDTHGLSVTPSQTIPSRSHVRPPPTEEERAKLQILMNKTDATVSSFSQKTIHYTTMYAIHLICNHSFDPAIYQKIIQEGGDIEQAYLNTFSGSVRQALHKAAFRTISWFIEPMISKTMSKVVTDLRKFLNSDVDLLHLIQKKMGDMADYYGRIEKARRDYLQPNRSDECGTFDNFLQETIKVYGPQKLTKEELTTAFSDYIVDNYVPKPDVRFFGYRLPLISTIFEWIGHAIRKALVRLVLNKAGVVKKILAQGTNSIYYAQLAVKQVLVQKLDQVLKVIQQSRVRPVAQLDPGQPGPNPPPPPQIDLEARKVQLISRQLLLCIQQHSSKLLRFIEIESCNGDDRKLADLDNRVNAFVTEILSALSSVYKGEVPSIGKVLEDTVTDATVNGILALFEDKERQIEETFQTVFDILNRSFTYVPEDKRDEQERAHIAECARHDQNLSTLLEKVVQESGAAGIEKHLKNVTGAKHSQIKAYIQNEKELCANCVKELESLLKHFEIQNPAEQTAAPLKDHVSKIVSLIEQYYAHISAQLPSSELGACYSDVRGDVHNIYASAISHFNQLLKQIDQIAVAVNKIKETEDEVDASTKCESALGTFSLSAPYQEILQLLQTVRASLPLSMKNELEQLLDVLTQNRELLETTHTELITFDRRQTLNHDLKELHKKKQLFVDAESLLNQLKNNCLEYHDLKQPNQTYPTPEAVKARHKELFKNIRKQWKQLLGLKNQDPDFERDLFPHLKAENTQQLYDIFYPSFFAKKSPIFPNLATIQANIELVIKANEAQVSKLKETPATRDVIINQRTKLENLVTAQTKEITEKLQQNRIAQTLLGDNLKQSINKNRLEILKGQDFNSLCRLHEHFMVKGCISVGEMKLHNRVAPELTALVVPKIVDGLRTLIDSMSKPFHFEQVMIRNLSDITG